MPRFNAVALLVAWIALVIGVAALVAASLWYFTAAARDKDWPGGSSGVGNPLERPIPGSHGEAFRPVRR